MIEALIPGIDNKLEEIKELCQNKELRIGALETHMAIRQDRQNIVYGVLGLIGSVLGGVAVYFVTHWSGKT